MSSSGTEVIHVYHTSACDLAKRIRARRPEATVVPLTTHEKALSAIGEAELLLTDAGSEELWQRGTQLKLVQAAGVGVDHLGSLESIASSAFVAGLRGLVAESVAEHAVALLLALHRGIPSHIASQREGRWRPFPCKPLSGERAVVLGLGEIGQRIAAALSALGMTVDGLCREPRRVSKVGRVVGPDDLHSILDGARLVIAALPLTSATEGLVGETELGLLADQALIVNVGRGAVFDEVALANAVLDGAIGGLGIDTFSVEPLPEESPLWTLPNLLITPHVAGWVPNYDELCLGRFLGNVDRLSRGEAPVGLVNREAGY